MNSTNVIALDEVGLAPGQIMADSVREWWPNCQTGQFGVMPGQPLGASLDMEIIAAAPYRGAIFNYKVMDWIGIWFVDPDGFLSSLLIKTESRRQFLELYRQQKRAGKTLLGTVVRGKMAPRANTHGKFFAVEFSVLDRPPQFAEAIAAFRQQYDYQAMMTFPEASSESESKALAAA